MSSTNINDDFNPAPAPEVTAEFAYAAGNLRHFRHSAGDFADTGRGNGRGTPPFLHASFD